jgi:heme-degrading monooxygenase HmoA
LNTSAAADDHIAIVTYWRSYAEHERSHADSLFKEKFSAMGALCTDSKELGYEMLWQGEPE